MLPVPINIAILVAFGLAYGWILHRAVNQSVYKPTGIRALDSYFLVWFFGLMAAFTPVVLYIAFGFDEFSDTPDGRSLLHRLRSTARVEVAGMAIYAVIIMLTVPQVPMKH
jgi:hypothetical protein